MAWKHENSMIFDNFRRKARIFAMAMPAETNSKKIDQTLRIIKAWKSLGNGRKVAWISIFN